MVVDVYKVFTNLMKSRYLKDTYFIDSCLRYDSRFREETNLEAASLRAYMEDNNTIIDCGKKRKYCDLDSAKEADLEVVSITKTLDLGDL